MKVFYIDTDEFKDKYDKEFLKQYADVELKTDKRFYEYTIGRFLVKTVAEQIYCVKDSEIIKDNSGKPVFKNGEICFNLSHSDKYVVACFDAKPCGLDIERIKERDLDKLSKYYDRAFGGLDDFYKFWTEKESTYKLGTDVKAKYTTKFMTDYYMTITSSENIPLPTKCLNLLDIYS